MEKITRQKTIADLPIDAPVMVCDQHDWIVRYYAGDGTCFIDGKTSSETGITEVYNYIIPVSEFAFYDLMHNFKSTHNYGRRR